MQKIRIGVGCAAAALAAYWFVPGFSDYVNQLANNIKLSHVWNYMATKAHSMTSYFMPTTPINTQK